MKSYETMLNHIKTIKTDYENHLSYKYNELL